MMMRLKVQVAIIDGGSSNEIWRYVYLWCEEEIAAALYAADRNII
jgi:hypothetical protein